MKPTALSWIKIALLVLTILILWWMLELRLSSTANLSLIVGGTLLVFPVVWLGRLALDRKPAMSRVVWVTTFVHYAVVTLFGAALLRAVLTHQEWPGWRLPIPTGIGLVLVIITGAAAFSTVANLALKGLGAPFAIALSQKLALEGWYAWTRNPMVLTTLIWFVSLGIWFQSALFVLWVLLLFAPALLFFVKVYEERELELRFGAPYLEYKSRTPMLFPRRPRSG